MTELIRLLHDAAARSNRHDADQLDRVRLAVGKDDVEGWNALLSAALHLRLDANRREAAAKAAADPRPTPRGELAKIWRGLLQAPWRHDSGEPLKGLRFAETAIQSIVEALGVGIAEEEEPVVAESTPADVERAFLNLCEALGIAATPAAYLDAVAARRALLDSTLANEIPDGVR